MPLFGHKKKHTAAESGLNDPMTRPVTRTGMVNNESHHTTTHAGLGTDHHHENAMKPGTFDRHGRQQQAQHPNEVHGGNALPHTGQLNNGDQSRSGQALAGKIERTVGSMVGSNTLKAKGYQKEQEAKAFNLQRSELAEAERLEREALMRRERAIGYGAHPDNRNLGAGWKAGGGSTH